MSTAPASNVQIIPDIQDNTTADGTAADLKASASSRSWQWILMAGGRVAMLCHGHGRREKAALLQFEADCVQSTVEEKDTLMMMMMMLIMVFVRGFDCGRRQLTAHGPWCVHSVAHVG